MIEFCFSVPSTNSSITSGLINPSTLPHLLQTAAGPAAAANAQQLISALQPQMLNTVPPPPGILNPAPPPTLLQAQQTPTGTPGGPAGQQQQSAHRNSNLNQAQFTGESKIHPQNIAVSRPVPTSSSSSALSSISRLAASTNGEITITTSHGPTSSQHSMKSSPPHNLSPSCNDSSSADLLIDSPSK